MSAPDRRSGPDPETLLFAAAVAVVVSLPYPLRLAGGGGVVPFVVTPAMPLVAVVGVLLAVVAMRSPGRIADPGRGDRLAAWFLLGWTAVAAAAASLDVAPAARQVVKLGAAVVLYLAVRRTVDRPSRAAVLVGALALAAVPVAGLAVLERFAGRAPLAFLTAFAPRTGFLPEAQVIRAQATLAHPNLLAELLVRAVVLLVGGWAALMLATRGDRWMPRDAGAAAAVAVLAAGLAYTYSRAGLVTAIAGMVLLLVGARLASVPRLGLVRVIAGAVVVAAVLAAAAAADAPLQHRVASVGDRGYGPDRERAHLWRSGTVVLLEHPLLGVGPDNFRLAYQRGFAADAPYSTLAVTDGMPNHHSHNLYLETALDAGLPGLGLLLWLLAAVGWRAWRGLRGGGPPWVRAMTAAGVAALAASLVHGLVDFVLRDLEMLLGFWVLLGLAASAPEIAAGSGDRAAADVSRPRREP